MKKPTYIWINKTYTHIISLSFRFGENGVYGHITLFLELHSHKMGHLQIISLTDLMSDFSAIKYLTGLHPINGIIICIIFWQSVFTIYNEGDVQRLYRWMHMCSPIHDLSFDLHSNYVVYLNLKFSLWWIILTMITKMMKTTTAQQCLQCLMFISPSLAHPSSLPFSIYLSVAIYHSYL